MPSSVASSMTSWWTSFSILFCAAEREHQCEYEEAHSVPDDIVPQQRRCDNARCQLRAGDLDRDQQGTKREDHEGKRCGDKSPEQYLCAGHG